MVRSASSRVSNHEATGEPAMIRANRKTLSEDAREAGFVYTVVPPGLALVKARKMVCEICALPADAVALSRKLVKFPIEDIVRRIYQENFFSESE
jgi:enoyl-CoA hydratase/carnithine racemase